MSAKQNGYAFVKYHGNGNDFIIFDSFSSTHKLSEQWLLKNASRLCERHRGIGADGIIVLTKKEENPHFFMDVINRDGSVAKNCGNGLRCAAHFLFQTLNVDEVTVSLCEKVYACRKVGDAIFVLMGECEIRRSEDLYFETCEAVARIAFASIGNEHVVLFFEKPIENFDDVIKEATQKLSIDQEINICISFLMPQRRYFSLVYERGVGFTDSCGSGACAAASFLSMLFGDEISDEIIITQPGGELSISINQKAFHEKSAVFYVSQKGVAEEVFKGVITVDDHEPCKFSEHVTRLL